MAEAKKPETSEEEVIGTHNLKPAQSKPRKRVGRGHGSGTGKTSGRGHKGQGSRSGGKPGPAYEGGQTPIHMRMRKLRGPTKKTSMPFEPFRTQTQPVNVDDLERLFEAGDTVNPETLAAQGPCHAQGRSGEDARPRRDHQEARHHRRQVLGRGAEEDRSRWRYLHRDRRVGSAPAAFGGK